MLLNLQIENIAIIEKASVDFVSGFNVLTGETGAGKSIMIDAINAVLGEKTSRELIRTGASSAFVSALFSDISDTVLPLLEEHGIEAEPDHSLLLQRKMTKDGKNVCRVNGTVVTVSALRKIGQALINIHGQRDSQELLNAEKHYRFVDLFGKTESCLQPYQECYRQWVQTGTVLRGLEKNTTDNERKKDILQYQINELESANIRIGERDELLNRKKMIRNLGKLTEALNSALAGAESSFHAAEDAYARIEEAAKISPPIGALNASVAEASSVMHDVASEIGSVLSQLDFSDEDLSSIEERLDVLYRLSKKYGATEEEMLSYLSSCKKELSETTFSDSELEELREKEAQLHEQVIHMGRLLTCEREKAASLLRERVREELHFLDMPHAEFFTEITPCEPGADGCDSIAFYISANPGETPKPLVKVASGGELSRVMLAIKNVLAEKDTIGTLIFDEIDAGVSGRAAEKIGKKLKEASRTRQVLCITHLSQIACRADCHFLIEKQVEGEKTYTTVTPLSFEGRVDELARMNGGITLTDVHRASARQLLQEADGCRL